MNTVRRGKRQVKGEEPKRVTLADFALHAPVDTLVELIQALIPLGLMAVGDCLKADVARLAGARYRRGDGLAGHVRWGRQRLIWPSVPIQGPGRGAATSTPMPGGCEGVDGIRSTVRGSFKELCERPLNGWSWTASALRTTSW